MRRHFATALYRAFFTFYPSARPAPLSANPFLSTGRTGPAQTGPPSRRKTDTRFYSFPYISLSLPQNPYQQKARAAPRTAKPAPAAIFYPFTAKLTANGTVKHVP